MKFTLIREIRLYKLSNNNYLKENKEKANHLMKKAKKHDFYV